MLVSHPFSCFFPEYFQQTGSAQAQTQSLIDESVCLTAGFLATNPLTYTETHTYRHTCLLIQRFPFFSVPKIKTEPHDDFDVPLVCSQQSPKPYFPMQTMSSVMTPDLIPCVVGRGYPISQQILIPKPSSLPLSSSQIMSPQLQELSPLPFTPHVSIIQEAPGHYQSPNLNLPSSSSTFPSTQHSTPTDITFCPSNYLKVSGSSSPGAQRHPKDPERRNSSQPILDVSIKQEPQELDQMYLDDGMWELFY